MTSVTLNHFIDLTRPLFPKEARIKVLPNSNPTLEIDWALRNDPSRPHKRSKKMALSGFRNTLI